MLLGQAACSTPCRATGWFRRYSAMFIPSTELRGSPICCFSSSPALFAAFLPTDIVGEMTSIGTLFAFILVCAGDYDHARTPAGASRGLQDAVRCRSRSWESGSTWSMIYGLGWTNWARLVGWMAIGLIIYFAYSRKHSITHNLATGNSIRDEPSDSGHQQYSRGGASPVRSASCARRATAPSRRIAWVIDAAVR